MFDSHCHLDAAEFDADRSNVLTRAAGAGVTGLVVPAVDETSWARIAGLIAGGEASHPRIHAALGIHPVALPEMASAADEAVLERLAELLDKTTVVAVGECGLDSTIDLARAPMERQEWWLSRQIDLANERRRPVILHARGPGTYDRLEALLKTKPLAAGAVIHSYGGGAERLRAFLDHPVMFGFAGPVTYPNARKVRASLVAVPEERLLLETEAPDQTPAPHRPRRCEPAHLSDVLDAAARLFGEPGMERLWTARVKVFGLGGVGSWAAESLARSGVGHLTLVDFDSVCATNVNRQLHAMKGTIGKSKVELMAERCRLISPDAEVVAEPHFYNADTSAQLLPPGEPVDVVIDAIDNMKAKLHLLATCVERGIPVISSMGAAGRLDPTQVRMAELCETYNDPFAKDVRKLLRLKHGIDTSVPCGIKVVFSPERRSNPEPLSYDHGTGFLCVCPGKENDFHTCDHRTRIDGTAGFVTGAFGLVAASAVVRTLIGR